jgi:hypothetical protein
MVSGWLGADWGNVPGWFGTALTSGSIAFAAWTYRRSVRDKERAQASSIAAWMARRWDEDGTQHRLLLVSNGSDASVYEVSVRLPESRSPA